jgi:hypothetical protein
MEPVVTVEFPLSQLLAILDLVDYYVNGFQFKTPVLIEAHHTLFEAKTKVE